jgi:stage V sporulation protein SpoVS
MKATGWQPHSVRGALAGAIKKKIGHKVQSEKTARGERLYRLT